MHVVEKIVTSSQNYFVIHDFKETEGHNEGNIYIASFRKAICCRKMMNALLGNPAQRVMVVK
jgi:hypothetical protein